MGKEGRDNKRSKLENGKEGRKKEKLNNIEEKRGGIKWGKSWDKREGRATREER